MSNFISGLLQVILIGLVVLLIGTMIFGTQNMVEAENLVAEFNITEGEVVEHILDCSKYTVFCRLVVEHQENGQTYHITYTVEEDDYLECRRGDTVQVQDYWTVHSYEVVE